MPLLSVVTAARAPIPDFLAAAYRSLDEQPMPQGWEWEWIIQEDGDDSLLRESPLPADERIQIAAGRPAGVALTRNMALARSSGELVKNLDSDDILGAGVLGRDIQATTKCESVHWSTSRLLDLLPDGTTVGFDNDPPSGPLEPGTVYEHWHTHNYRLPVHPASLCIQRPLLLALGGWMGIPGSEDSALLLAASTITRGFFHGEVGLWYRKWDGQLTASPIHVDRNELRLRISLMTERVAATKSIFGRGE